MRAALILAGGKAVRVHGKEKPFLMLKGKPLLQWVIESVKSCVDEIIVSGEANLEKFGYPVVKDQFENVGPLAGFHAGFSIIRSDYTFVTGCDMPFINPHVIEYLFEKSIKYSCCLPREGDYIEPLCCVYRTKDVRSCSISVIDQGKKRLSDLIQCLPNPQYVSFEEIRKIDPDLLSFKNINTFEDLESVERLL